jgi:hypothetical protein
MDLSTHGHHPAPLVFILPASRIVNKFCTSAIGAAARIWEPTAGEEGSANRLREREADALRKPLARHESPGSFG